MVSSPDQSLRRKEASAASDNATGSGGGESDAGSITICGLRTRPSPRTLSLSFLILACTAYFAVEVGRVSVTGGTTLTREASSSPPDAEYEALGGSPQKPSVAITAPASSSAYSGLSYPWANSPKDLLNQLETGKTAAKEARALLDKKHYPHGENLFPTVNLFNSTHLQRRLAESILTQGEFIIGVMGTSVTAGHDNYFNQSFPVVWGRIMEEAFAATGVKLTVRNHAMGWNPVNPSYYCVGEMVGEDVDVTVWEFGMMGGDDGDSETWIRSSLSLPKQPQVLFLDPGLGARDDAKEPREGKPSPWMSNPMRAYTDMGFSVASQVMEHAYWRTDHLPEYNAYSMIPKDKPTDRPAGWHPGPHGHRLRAEILAYNYLGYLIEAIDAVTDVVAKEKDVAVLLPQRITLEPPKWCQKDLCTVAPKCVTTFVPRVGESLLDYVTFPKDIPWVTDGGIAASNGQEGWHMQLYFCDVGAVDYMLGKGFDYLDRKYILQGNNHDGPVRVEFETKSNNYIVICSAPGNAHICRSSTWKIDGKPVKCLNEDTREGGQPRVHEPCFITERKYGPGKHTFELEMHEPWQDHDNFIPFSHMIWW